MKNIKGLRDTVKEIKRIIGIKEALLKQFVPEEKIRVTKITEEMWPDENWKRLGGVIEVIVERRR